MKKLTKKERRDRIDCWVAWLMFAMLQKNKQKKEIIEMFIDEIEKLFK